MTDNSHFNVEYRPDFIRKDVADYLYQEFSKLFSKTSSREAILFGNKDLKYVVEYGGYKGIPKTIQTRIANDWSNDKKFKFLLTELEKQTNQKYTVCIVQYYPNGKVGIGKHKDKEMVPGTQIAGLSLGQTRKLVMHPPKFLKGTRILDDGRTVKVPYSTVETDLTHGSLYILKPPTNDYWMHEIPKDGSIHPRISLTFRNY